MRSSAGDTSPLRVGELAAGLQAGNPVRAADQQGCVSAGILLADQVGDDGQELGLASLGGTGECCGVAGRVAEQSL
ncbi:hypothetical protein [Micromonospora profundi]|uniref:hypothetical protein n=1 Tax=Micromonospora TaxID=1873 RepID=UPI0033B92C61